MAVDGYRFRWRIQRVPVVAMFSICGAFREMDGGFVFWLCARILRPSLMQHDARVQLRVYIDFIVL